MKITVENFNDTYKLLVTNKDVALFKNYDIENYNINQKIDFVNKELEKYYNSDVLMRILFWEKTEKMSSFLSDIYRHSSCKGKISREYKSRASPGVSFIDKNINKRCVNFVLLHHFNFELAIDPSVNIKVQFAVNDSDGIIIYDFYDDRGFNVYGPVLIN